MYLITINYDSCDGCGSCIEACPAQYFALVDGKAEMADDGDCMGCESCVVLCPNEAVTMQEL